MQSATAFKSLHREPKRPKNKQSTNQTNRDSATLTEVENFIKKKKKPLFHSHLLRADAVSSKAGSWNNF